MRIESRFQSSHDYSASFAFFLAQSAFPLPAYRFPLPAGAVGYHHLREHEDGQTRLHGAPGTAARKERSGM